MRSTRKKKYGKYRRKKIKQIIVGITLTLILIGISQVSEKTYAFFSDSKTINASFNAAFVFPTTLQQIISSLPTIKQHKVYDENQLQNYEELANKLDQEITSYYLRATGEYELNRNDETKIVLDYVSTAYQEFKTKKQQLLDQITTMRKQIERKESEEKAKKADSDQNNAISQPVDPIQN
jgi:hypothetical protein